MRKRTFVLYLSLIFLISLAKSQAEARRYTRFQNSGGTDYRSNGKINYQSNSQSLVEEKASGAVGAHRYQVQSQYQAEKEQRVVGSGSIRFSGERLNFDSTFERELERAGLNQKFTRTLQTVARDLADFEREFLLLLDSFRNGEVSPREYEILTNIADCGRLWIHGVVKFAKSPDAHEMVAQSREIMVGLDGMMYWLRRYGQEFNYPQEEIAEFEEMLKDYRLLFGTIAKLKLDTK